MTVTDTAMPAAMQALEQVLHDSQAPGAPADSWRWAARRRMAELRDALVAETLHDGDGWMVAREDTVLRERNGFLARLGTLGPQVLEDADADGVRTELRRLLADLARHEQRLHDLAYDEVELELGGSE